MFIAAVGLVGSLEINYLSNKAVSEALTKNQNTIQRLQEIINNEMEKADRLVQLLAGSSRILYPGYELMRRRGRSSRANEVLDRYSQTEEGFGICYIMNLSRANYCLLQPEPIRQFCREKLRLPTLF